MSAQIIQYTVTKDFFILYEKGQLKKFNNLQLNIDVLIQSKTNNKIYKSAEMFVSQN